MYLSSWNVIVFTRPDAGMLPFRSAPIDRC
jgi:hypothetical protein